MKQDCEHLDEFSCSDLLRRSVVIKGVDQVVD